MYRLLFEKTGNAVWISHLDLMRLFQRAFKRAGFTLTHTQGYNPRPSVSIALPLSVGVASECELLDFDLEGDNVSCELICKKLNQALVNGVRVKTVYSDGKKVKELALLRSVITLEYDSGVPNEATDKLTALFSASSLFVPKKSKNGIHEQDIIPMIKQVRVERISEKQITITLLASCQNPSLNPMQLVAAVQLFAPDLSPDFACCRRVEIFDIHENVFR